MIDDTDDENDDSWIDEMEHKDLCGALRSAYAESRSLTEQRNEHSATIVVLREDIGRLLRQLSASGASPAPEPIAAEGEKQI